MNNHYKNNRNKIDESSDESILFLHNIRSGYGKKEILHAVTLTAKRGKITALIGPNGSGKSTVLKTIFGLLRVRVGNVLFNGATCVGEKPASLLEKGMVFVPQGNRVFTDLTVEQNVEIALNKTERRTKDERFTEIADLFPILSERRRQRAGYLSGGEKQQLALATALVRKPKFLLLDEPSLGLAPNLIEDVFTKLKNINQQLCISILIVEQKVSQVLQICHYVYALKLGKIFYSGLPSEIINNKDKLRTIFL